MEKRVEQIIVKLTLTEKDGIKKAAIDDGCNISDYVRKKLGLPSELERK